MRRNRPAQRVFSCVVLLFALAAVMVYLWGELFVTEFQSDVTDTLLWARETAESGRLVNPDFFYPYAIPFGGNLLLLPFYYCFGLSVTAMRAGMTAFIALLTAALVLFFDKAVFRSRYPAYFTVGVVLLFFLNNTKLREIMYGHIIHYSLAVLFIALLMAFLALYFQNEQENKKVQPVIWVLLAITAFFCAAEGMAVIALSAVPVVGACVLERIIQTWIFKQPYSQSKQDLKILSLLLTALAVGFAANKIAQGDVYTPYEEHFLNLAPPVLWGDNFMELGRQWSSQLLRPELYGDTALLAKELSLPGSLFYKAEKIFMLISPVALLPLSLWRYNKLETRIQRISVLSFWCLAAITVGLYVLTPVGGNNWRMIPLLFLMLVCVCVLLSSMIRDGNRPARISAAAAAGLITVFALNAGVGVMAAKTEADIWFQNGAVIDVLKKNGLKRGYSDEFLLCPATEVLTGGELQVKYSTLRNGKLYPLLYQNEISDYDFSDKDGEYFLVLVYGSADSAPAGGRSIYKGSAFIPSYSRMSDGYHEYEILVYDSDPAEARYIVHHSDVVLDEDGRECSLEDTENK